MRALIVDSDRVSAWSVADKLLEKGFTIIGPARSSGEALLLAESEQPQIAILSVNLESIGAGERLANKLTARHSTHCILTFSEVGEGNTPTKNQYFDRTDRGKITDAALNHRQRRNKSI